jgi:MoaA/NifB/PqqE/SkfB family radical SAM enzyme
LQGGEALIRKDIGQIIKKVNNLGMFCRLTTNGVLISENNIKILKNLDSISVSVDGPEIVNDENRGKGSYKKLVAGINLLLKNNIDVKLSLVITKESYKRIDEVIRFFTLVNFPLNISIMFGNQDYQVAWNQSELW